MKVDNFKCVYKILSTLENCLDLEEMNPDLISPKVLKISQERWNKYIEMMADVGYIKGVQISETISGSTIVEIDNIKITLKGLEYLQENSIMQKMQHHLSRRS